MSFQDAYDQVVAALGAVDGLHQCTDTSAQDKGDLARAGNEGGQGEGAFILSTEGWEPYPEISDNVARDNVAVLQFQVRAMADRDKLEKAKGRIYLYMHRFWAAIIRADASTIGAAVCAILPSGEKTNVRPDTEGKAIIARYNFRLIYQES